MIDEGRLQQEIIDHEGGVVLKPYKDHLGYWTIGVGHLIKDTEKNEFRNIKNCYYRNNIKSNCNGADLVVLLTEWDEFKSIDFKKIVKNNKFKVYDLRNLYSAEEMKKNKINYHSVGRPNIN